jgi:DNA-binding MarR family transcriptional regulator
MNLNAITQYLEQINLLGISVPTARVLHYLAMNPGRTDGEIRRALDLTSSALNVIISRLGDKGRVSIDGLDMIATYPCPTDSRTFYRALNAKGVEFYSKMMGNASDVFDGYPLTEESLLRYIEKR